MNLTDYKHSRMSDNIPGSAYNFSYLQTFLHRLFLPITLFSSVHPPKKLSSSIGSTGSNFSLDVLTAFSPLLTASVI